jgi:hypothetical protein
MRLAIENRELALTRVMLSGTTRGIAAAVVTAYARAATRQTKATGSTQTEPSASSAASCQDRNARKAKVAPIAQRRPWR